MSRPLIIREAAERDMADAFDWYEDQRPGLGAEFVHDAEQLLQTLVQRPLSFPIVEQVVRRALMKRFPYSVYFVVEEDALSVIAVLHGSRDPKHWQARA